MDNFVFPAEAVAKARSVAEQYRKRTRSNELMAAYLQDGKFLEIGYGFGESLKTGNCGRHLHEIVKEADCFTMAGSVLYLVAREAGLNPKLYWATNMNDSRECDSHQNNGFNEHAFILVRAGKDEQIVVDPQMGVFGYARIKPADHVIEVYNRKHRQLTSRTYAALTEMSEQEYLRQLEERRSAEGGKIALAATQKVHSDVARVYVTYIPQKREIKLSIRQELIKVSDKTKDRVLITDLVAPVERDGRFNLEDGMLYIYKAAEDGWVDHKDPRVPFVYSVKSAQTLWEVLDAVVRSQGRKTSAFRMAGVPLVEQVWDSGFRIDLSAEDGSLAEKVIKQRGLGDALAEARQEKDRSIERYLAESRTDVGSRRDLLRSAWITKVSESTRSKENPWALATTPEQRNSFLELKLKEYVQNNQMLLDAITEDAKIRARLKKGSEYHSDRRYNRAVSLNGKRAREFNIVCAMRKSRHPVAFDRCANDEIIFDLQQLGSKTMEELESGVSEENFRRAAEIRLFEWIVSAGHYQKAFQLNKYRKGLQRILAQ